MPGERPFLRLVPPPTELPEIPETRAFDWRTMPQSLEEVEAVTHVLQTLILDPGKNQPDWEEIITALQNIEVALREEAIGLEIEEQETYRSTNFLVNTFEGLNEIFVHRSIKNNAPLQTQLGLAINSVVSKITSLAAAGSQSPYAKPNPAFAAVLEIYAEHPDSQKNIRDELPSTNKINVPLEQRSEESAFITKIGRKLQGTKDTFTLVQRLGNLLRPQEIVYFNPTVYQRTGIKCETILEEIIEEVQGYFDAHVSKPDEPREKRQSLHLPEFGPFKTAAVVLPEAQRELQSYVRIRTQKLEAMTVNDCQSWFHVLWYINELVSPEQKIPYTIVNPQGLDELQWITGEELIYIIKTIPRDVNVIHHLPGEHNTRNPKGRTKFLVDLRAKLEYFLT